MTALIGRDSELAALKQYLAAAMSGKGSTVLISGEPGIGKTRLVEEFRKHAEAEGARILSGAAISGSAHPFQVFSKALEGVTTEPLFEESEYTSFTEIFAVNSAGLLLAKASSEEGGMDADIFAGMLSAVQDFVRDSFGQGGGKAGLGRLEYGDMKILIEHGQHLFLTAVFTGNEHPDMKRTVTRTLNNIEEKHGQLIQGWTGKMSDIAPVQYEITRLAKARFLVRKDLEGVKLENERLRIADRVLETLAQLSYENSLVMLLENMHWGDESSLFIFEYLARNIQGSKILMLGTSRPNESPALESAFEKKLNEEYFTELGLKKLEINDIVKIIKSMHPDDKISNDFINALAERCGGNPLFVIEFAKQMAIEGSFSMDARNLSVPDSIEDVIQARLASLSPEALAIAEYSSCIGNEFSIDTAMSMGTIGSPADALNELHETGITVRRNGTMAFCHAMYQEVIYSTMSQRWRGAHHRSLGEYIESTHHERMDDVLYELARHFSRTNEYSKAFDYCKRAGEKAESAYAPEQALAFYKDALDMLKQSRKTMEGEEAIILEKLGDVSAFANVFADALNYYNQASKFHEPGNAKARLFRKMAEAHFKTGEYEESLKSLDRAKDCMGEESSVEHGKILVSEGNIHIMRGDYEKSLTLLEKALAIFESQSQSKKDVGNTLRLFTTVYWRQGKYDIALEHVQKSLEVMEEINDMQGISLALNALGLVSYDMGQYDKSLEYYSKALDIMERTGNKYFITLVFNNLGLLYSSLGRFDIALDYNQKSLELRERIGDKEGISASLGNMGNLYNSMGDFTKAKEAFERSLAISKTLGAKKNIAGTLNPLGYICHLHGDLEKALEYYQQGIEICEEIGERYLLAHLLDNMGDLSLDKGDPEGALELYTKSLNLREDMENWNEVSWNHYEISLAHIQLRNLELALQHAEKARTLATDIGIVMETGTSYLALGIIHREKRNYDTAVDMFDTAKKYLAKSGHIIMLVIENYERGILHKKMGNMDKAEELLKKALSEFERLGMRLWAEKCRKALEGSSGTKINDKEIGQREELEQ